jgi:hypothetical protein
MSRIVSIGIGISIIGLSTWYFLSRRNSPSFDTSPGDIDNPVEQTDNVSFNFGSVLSSAQTFLQEGILSIVGASNIPPAYKPLIDIAEKQYSIPSGMLGRLLYQESRFRDDIISGQKKSPVGAIGIAQFMPATAKDLGVNPYDPSESILGAARYLASLKKSLGDWSSAVAAYNWGIGNFKRKGMAAAPTETVNYVKAIIG